jgi:WD40 repeat protein
MKSRPPVRILVIGVIFLAVAGYNYFLPSWREPKFSPHIKNSFPAHKDMVRELFFVNNDSFVSNDKFAVYHWDREGYRLNSFKALSLPGCSVRIDRYNQEAFVASLSENPPLPPSRMTLMVNLKTGKTLWKAHTINPPKDLVSLPKKHTIVELWHISWLTLRDARTGEVRSRILARLGDKITVSPGGCLFAQGGDEHGPWLGDLCRKKNYRRLTPPSSPSFAPGLALPNASVLLFIDDNRLIVGGKLGGHIWDIKDSKLLHIFPAGDGELHDWLEAALSPDKSLLAVSSRNGALVLIDPTTGHSQTLRPAQQLKPNTPRKVIATALDFSPDGKTLAEGRTDGSVHIWKLSP